MCTVVKAPASSWQEVDLSPFNEEQIYRAAVRNLSYIFETLIKHNCETIAFQLIYVMQQKSCFLLWC